MHYGRISDACTTPWQLHIPHQNHRDPGRELSARASAGGGDGAASHQGSKAAVDKNEDQLDLLLGTLSKLRASQPESASGRYVGDEDFGDEYEEGEEGVDWEWWRADGGDTVTSDASSSSSSSSSGSRKNSPSEHELQASLQRHGDVAAAVPAPKASFADAAGRRAGQAGRGSRGKGAYGPHQESRAGQGRGRGESGRRNESRLERGESQYGNGGFRRSNKRSPAMFPEGVKKALD
ncbi:hypothetical protein DUNSADRAFT_14775 [Dunaliella salina]|uniref:Encoded protein n=1 Tax=Dunaliella salina TaxID=3046 RepID=A0ABQ7G6R4_DUNSA|nr:hypothetical protein DUNSADRAFT_14775 [Dunaliella salina]|eukprot:KAF5830301.1 hypothetical protein DUNSADRAFT_14775 [Dunaliella salina]